ncbi:MAG: hypothetical protein H7257_07870, partial [Taibaiella sp.]|nr:hypothetical protein [Taibaiella sp.]
MMKTTNSKRWKITATPALLTAAFFLISFIVPKGWQKSGPAENKYEIGLWKVGGNNDSKMCGVIRSGDKNYYPDDYGSMMQKVSSQQYLGKRVRLTGFMKSRAVTAWAGFYLRADNEDSKEPLTFDNMHDRPITGNTVWKEYKIELDVPYNASKIAFGALLHGEGQIWFDDLKLEIVGESTIKADYVKCDTTLKRVPENLDFE